MDAAAALLTPTGVDINLFWRLLESVLFFFSGLVAAWLIPAMLQVLFQSVLKREIPYYPPPLHGETDWHYQDSRRRYSRASYWRTGFFHLLYALIGISAVITGIMIALWLLHWDLWIILSGLGLYTAIALFQVGTYLQNVWAFFCLKTDCQRELHEGDFIEVTPYRGYLISIGMQRSCLFMPATSPSSLPPMPPALSGGFQGVPATTPVFIPAPPPPSSSTTARFSVDATLAQPSSLTLLPPGYRATDTYIFIPTAALMQVVILLDRDR
jgi:hypothetical protein